MIALGDVSIASSRRSEATAASDRSLARDNHQAPSDNLAFSELFGSVQAMFGARIDAVVQSIIPDGRGLQPSMPDAHDKRLAQLSEDVRQAQQCRREEMKNEAATEPTRSRVDKTGRRQSVEPPAGDRTGGMSRSSTTNAASGGPVATGSESSRGVAATATPPTAEPLSANPPPSAVDAGDGERMTMSSSRSATTTKVEPLRTPPGTPAPTAISGTASVSASVHSDGGALARQIGEVLGARGTGESGRSTSAVQSAPAASAGTNKQGQSRDTRVPGRSERMPGRPWQPKEAQSSRRTAFDRLVRSIRMNIGQQASTARLHLAPPDLGRVRIDVRMVNQCMQLSIQTETHDARDVLSSRLDGLRGALANTGVTIERIELTMPSADSHEGALAGQNDQTRRRTADSAAGNAGIGNDETATNDLQEGEEVPPELVEAVLTGAASEMRLDIRV